MRDEVQSQFMGGKTNSGIRKKIRTSTGTIILLAAAVIIFGGSYTYANVLMLQPDYTVNLSYSVVKKTTDATKDWKTYTNATYGYSLKYPTDWIVDSSNSEQGFTPRGTNKELIGGDLIIENHPTRTSVLDVESSDLGIFSMIYKNSSSLSDFFNEKYKNSGTISDVKSFRVGDKDAYQFVSTSIDAPVGQMGIFTLIKNQSNEIMVISFNGSSGPNKLPDRTNYDNILGSLMFTATTASTSVSTSTSTTATATPDSTSQTYTNSTYGFILTLPATWSAYKVKTVTVEGAVASFFFELPTTDSFYQSDLPNSDAGYADVFSVNVMNKADWTGDGESFGSKIAENSSYVFASGSSQADPNEAIFTTARSQIQSIVDTFTLK